MISGDRKQIDNINDHDGNDSVRGGKLPGFKGDVVLLAIPVLAAVTGFITLPAHPPLLDEQFLLTWISSAGAVTDFLNWSGFESYDNWGWFSNGLMLASGAIFGKYAVAFRFLCILIHCLSTALVVLIARSLRLNRAVSCAAACLFAINPLTLEAVAWSGGIASLLGGCLLFFSLWLYSRMRRSGIQWPLLLAALASYALAMATSVNFWFAPLMVLWLEISALPFRRQNERKPDFTEATIPFLLFLMISAVFVAGQGLSSLSVPDFKFGNVAALFRDLVMPVNQVFWNKYAKEYKLLYMIFGLLAPAAAAALLMNGDCRRVALLSLGWLAITALPFCGVVLVEPGLYGSRWLYSALLPLSLLGGLACAGISAIKVQRPLLLQATAALLTLSLAIFYFRHLWSGNQNYRNQARILASVQKSVKIANAKLDRSYLILTDLPRRLSVAPAFSRSGPVCFDAETGLLRSNGIPDGQLKEHLRHGKLVDIVLRWEPNLKSFIPLDLNPVKATWPDNPTPADIGYRLEPRLPFYKTVSIDEPQRCMILETNSDNGPLITLTSCELSPIDGDYLSVDARIDCPPSVVSPRIELHWQTNVHQHFERRERFAYAQALVNDQQFHRYFLSIRRNGWTVGGSPQFIALGFPAGAKVWLKSIGLHRGTEAIARLRPRPRENAFTPAFTPPYFRYPYQPELGLIALPQRARSLSAEYSVDHVSGAQGALVEVSGPGKDFDDANGNHLSSVTYRTFRLNSTAGRLDIPVSDLPGPGVYSVRLIGVDRRGGFKGLFSDALCFQVPSGGKQ